MAKITINSWKKGQGESHAHLLPITEFLVRQGFTPVFPMVRGDWNEEPLHCHTVGDGWVTEKGERRWSCKEPIPKALIEENFNFPKSVRFSTFAGDDDVGICCDDTRASIR